MKYTRQRLGILQQDFADEIGLLRTTLSRIENENKVMMKHFVRIHHSYAEYFPFPENFDMYKIEYIYQYWKAYGEYPTDIEYPVDFFDFSTENVMLNIRSSKTVSADDVAVAFGYKNQFGLALMFRKNKNFYEYKDILKSLFNPYFVKVEKKENDSKGMNIDQIEKYRIANNLSRVQFSKKTGISPYLLKKAEIDKEIKADNYILLNKACPKVFKLPKDFYAYDARNVYFNFLCGFSKYSKIEISKKFGYSSILAMYSKQFRTKNMYEYKKLIDEIFDPYLIASYRENDTIVNAIEKIVTQIST